MRLFDPAILSRTKICPSCDWLFIDQSKNQSRLWCDMAVCGNRAKAKAHYRRKSDVGKSVEEKS
jgi:predicted RNA-binding Zn ribbon-like protein